MRDQRVFRFFEEHHRIHDRPHRFEERVEHVNAHEAALMHRIVVEVLMPEVVIDDDQVAFLPPMVLAVIWRDAHEAVAVPFDDVEPRFARVAVQRLRLARGELNHHLRQPGGLVADRAIVEELGARAARRRENLLLVIRRVDASRPALLRLDVEAPQPAGVRIVARDPPVRRADAAESVAKGSRPRVLDERSCRASRASARRSSS